MALALRLDELVLTGQVASHSTLASFQHRPVRQLGRPFACPAAQIARRGIPVNPFLYALGQHGKILQLDIGRVCGKMKTPSLLARKPIAGVMQGR
jgi:hypothetical protein